MKKDLDGLMAKHQIDAILVTGRGDHNPSMVYMTGGAHLTGADFVKIRDGKGVLFHGMMERDEAKKTGWETRSFSLYPMTDLVKETAGDWQKAIALRYKKMLEDVGFSKGRLALYGQVEAGYGYGIFSMLRDLLPEIELVGMQTSDLMLSAMMTKDAKEIARIQKMGSLVTEIVGKVSEFLTTRKVRQDEVLLDEDGDPVTVGLVKRKINLWLAEGGAENPEGTIFAIGRDAGVPHSSGEDQDLICLGKTIVFDFFPCEMGGGYFYDFTRTWSLGYASDESKKVFQDVYDAYQQIVSELKVNTPFKHYQQRTCEIFEGLGHATIQSQPNTEEGYIHSLGHGLGLRVHEKPFSGLSAGADEILAPGCVFTIEPGLYYPDKGMGVRIEDTWFVTEDGQFKLIAEYPKDFVLKMKYWAE